MPAKTASSQRTTSSARSVSARSGALTASQQEEVSRIAYQLWIDGGCQHGRHQEDWAKAEAVLRSKLS